MPNSQLPFSQASENNKQPILSSLKNYICSGKSLLEVGHGNAQHSVFMSAELEVNWFPSDLEENNWIATKRKELSPTPFVQAPLVLEVGSKPLKEQIQQEFDYIYTANTLHIMSERNVITFCNEVSELMKSSAYLFIYGPFKFQGQYTSESNESFQGWLQQRNPLSGIRDFELIQTELKKSGISFSKRYNLPANNQLLVFQKLPI